MGHEYLECFNVAHRNVLGFIITGAMADEDTVLKRALVKPFLSHPCLRISGVWVDLRHRMEECMVMCGME